MLDEDSFQPEDKKAEPVAFADNTTFGGCKTDKTSLMSKLKEILEEVYLWMDLLLMFEKSCVLLFFWVGRWRSRGMWYLKVQRSD